MYRIDEVFFYFLFLYICSMGPYNKGKNFHSQVFCIVQSKFSSYFLTLRSEAFFPVTKFHSCTIIVNPVAGLSVTLNNFSNNFAEYIQYFILKYIVFDWGRYSYKLQTFASRVLDIPTSTASQFQLIDPLTWSWHFSRQLLRLTL